MISIAARVICSRRSPVSSIQGHIVYQETMLVICTRILSDSRVKSSETSFPTTELLAWKREKFRREGISIVLFLLRGEERRLDLSFPGNSTSRSIIILQQSSVQSHGRLFRYRVSISCRGLSSLCYEVIDDTIAPCWEPDARWSSHHSGNLINNYFSRMLLHTRLVQSVS